MMMIVMMMMIMKMMIMLAMMVLMMEAWKREGARALGKGDGDLDEGDNDIYKESRSSAFFARSSSRVVNTKFDSRQKQLESSSRSRR